MKGFLKLINRKMYSTIFKSDIKADTNRVDSIPRRVNALSTYVTKRNHANFQIQFEY